MRRLVLPFFVMRLLIVVSPTLLQVAVETFSFYPLVLATLLVSTQLGVVGHTLTLQPASTPAPETTSPLTQPLTRLTSSHLPLQPLTTTKSEDLIQVQETWLKLYQLQPTHRDVLINLGLLALYQEDELNFNRYWQQARDLDPNYPLFATPSR